MNIMGQYKSQYHAFNYEEINRRPTSDETCEVKRYVKKLGIIIDLFVSN